jgi:hypothetical protein
METAQVKSNIIRVIQELPEDATVEDAMEHLYFLAKIERGLDSLTVRRSRMTKSKPSF